MASWLGLLVLGVKKIADRWWVSHTRQLCFEVGKKRYKVRYGHRVDPRGGIEFVEVERSQGQPEIRVVKAIKDLSEAADRSSNTQQAREVLCRIRSCTKNQGSGWVAVQGR